jgi:K+-sensing histidine kinase KdpD
MAGFIAGMALGCLIGVCGTYAVLFLAATAPEPFPVRMKEFSALKFAVSLLTISALGGACFRLNVHKSSTVLVLLLGVFVVARLAGIVVGLFASIVSAILLSLLFLSPIGSLRISRPSDQFLLALFLVSSLLGCRLIGRSKSLNEGHS